METSADIEAAWPLEMSVWYNCYLSSAHNTMRFRYY